MIGPIMRLISISPIQDTHTKVAVGLSTTKWVITTICRIVVIVVNICRSCRNCRNYDTLRHSTTLYDTLRHSTTFYDNYDNYDNCDNY
jgi:hypothetical protein